MSDAITVGNAPVDSNKRVKIMLGVAALLLFVVVVLPKLLGGGDGALPPDEFSVDAGVVAGGGPVTPAPVPVGDAQLSAAGRAKNPFRALRAGEGAVSSVSSGTGVAPIVNTAPAPAVIAPFEAGAPPEDQASAYPAESTRQPMRVSLLEVYRAADDRVTATVRVGDLVSDVVQGDTFGGWFDVESLDVGSRCGTFLADAQPFNLCESEEVIK